MGALPAAAIDDPIAAESLVTAALGTPGSTVGIEGRVVEARRRAESNAVVVEHLVFAARRTRR
jgi:hypothetical protein